MYDPQDIPKTCKLIKFLSIFRPLLSRHSPRHVLRSQSIIFIVISALLTGNPVISTNGVDSGFVPVDAANATKPEWTIRIDNGLY